MIIIGYLLLMQTLPTTWKVILIFLKYLSKVFLLHQAFEHQMSSERCSTTPERSCCTLCPGDVRAAFTMALAHTLGKPTRLEKSSDCFREDIHAHTIISLFNLCSFGEYAVLKSNGSTQNF